MFERFTDRARSIVVNAERNSRERKHLTIGTEHLLLAMLQDDGGIAGVVLRELGFSVESVSAEIAEQYPNGTEEPTGHIPFTPRTKRVLELSLREALSLGHNYIGTEHLLLGLIRDGDQAGEGPTQGIGARIITSRYAPQLVREQIIKKLMGELTKADVQVRDQDAEVEEDPPASPETLGQFMRAILSGDIQFDFLVAHDGKTIVQAEGQFFRLEIEQI